MDLQGSCILVTGASGFNGVGGETAQAVASAGGNVVVNYATNREGAQRVADACESHGTQALVVGADVSDDGDARRLVAEAVERFGRLDGLVNNAAVTSRIAIDDLEGLDAEEFQRTIAVNLVGAFQVTRAAAPHLRASGDGAVVNVSSASAEHGAGSSMAYSASKGALNTLTRSFARTLAPEVRVNAVLPRGMLGGWTRRVFGDEDHERREREVPERFLLQRAPYPNDVAQTILWMLGGAHLMTGAFIPVDGGQNLR